LLNIVTERAQAFHLESIRGFRDTVARGDAAGPVLPAKIIAYLTQDYWFGADVMRIMLSLCAGFGNYLLLRSMGAERG
jgi:hypothetical protein